MHTGAVKHVTPTPIVVNAHRKSLQRFCDKDIASSET